MGEATTRRAALRVLAAGAALPSLGAAAAPARAPASGAPPIPGPLRRCARNPRYFETADGRALLLAGNHTWISVQDFNTVPGFTDPPEPFGNGAFLRLLVENGGNLTRLWRREGSRTERAQPLSPLPWLRTGPGEARDGQPRFDLTRFDDRYFDRLLSRVRDAASHGIVPIVMLFDGWGMEAHTDGDPWPWHPFNAVNNVNGIDGDPGRQGHGRALTSLRLPEALALQEDFVRRCVATLADCELLLWEVGNEIKLERDTIAWTRHMVRFIRRAQEGQRWQHPVGVTAPYPDHFPEPAMHAFTAESGADWVSPHGWNRYQDDPPEAKGRQVSIMDTDHTFGVGGDASWVWKQVLRGHNVLVMDGLGSRAEIAGRGVPVARLAEAEDGGRRGLAGVRLATDPLDLARCVPAGGLSSTGYCLAWPGRQYLVFAPAGSGAFTLDLSAAAGRRLAARWIEVERPERGLLPAREGRVEGGGLARFDPSAVGEGPAALLLTLPARRASPGGGGAAI